MILRLSFLSYNDFIFDGLEFIKKLHCYLRVSYNFLLALRFLVFLVITPIRSTYTHIQPGLYDLFRTEDLVQLSNVDWLLLILVFIPEIQRFLHPSQFFFNIKLMRVSLRYQSRDVLQCISPLFRVFDVLD